ncbi:MAG: ribosome maturation factor RimP [Clostridiales bacterium]|nr:ribosome maturation factor RimP [Candidatus Crickella equi]
MEKIETLLNEYLADKDLELYRLVHKKEGKDWVLRVLLDKPEGSEQEYVDIEECEEVARWLSDKLDEIDFSDKQYNLEVCSPGLDRELIKDSDFRRFAGRVVEVKTYEQINGMKNFEGTLIGKEDNVIKLDIDGATLELPADKVSKINLAVIF